MNAAPSTCGRVAADGRRAPAFALSLITGFENFSVFRPGDDSVDALRTLLDQVVGWSAALAPLGAAASAA